MTQTMNWQNSSGTRNPARAARPSHSCSLTHGLPAQVTRERAQASAQAARGCHSTPAPPAHRTRIFPLE